MKRPLAVLCSDLHLCHTRPVVRSDSDWYGYQASVLDQITELSKSLDVPVVIAGDVFDRWQSPPSLINLALDHLPPKCYTIPGQHDLPNHNVDEIKRSAYWTLVMSKRIKHIKKSGLVLGECLIAPFYWGEELSKLIDSVVADRADADVLCVAVCHRYIWKGKKTSYPGATKEQKASIIQKRLEGFHVAVFGDNHIPFELESGGYYPLIFNCGTLMRRKADEISLLPRLGILFSDGTVESHYLDTSMDTFSEEHLAGLQSKGDVEIDVSVFLEELKSLGSDSLDFREAVNRFLDLNKVDQSVRRFVLESIG